jgi:hypothetical protein
MHSLKTCPELAERGRLRISLVQISFLRSIYPSISDTIAWKRKPPLCHPERTQISYFTALPAATYAALLKEGRMKSTEATAFDRKSEEAEGPAVRLDVKQRPSLLPTARRVSCLRRTNRLVKICELTARPLFEVKAHRRSLGFLRGCDFFNFLWPESCEEHLPISIAGVLRLRAVSPVLSDRSARRFAQDDDSVVGIKNVGSSAKNTKRSKKSQALRMDSSG